MTNRVLIITGDANDAKALQDVLGKAKDGSFTTEWVTQLSDGLKRLHAGGIDAIMADLSLPDSQGIDTFDKLFATALHTPIMTLSALDDEMLTTEAVQHGAQGYLSKGHFGSYLVPQSLRIIIQRKSVEETFYLEKARAEITLNSISDAVIGTDMSGNVDYLNVAAENMTGWSREEARGHPIGEVMQIIDGETRQRKQNPVELVLQQNKPMKLTTGTILIRRDGREVAIEDSAAPIHDWNGKITGSVIVFHDITASQEMALKMAYLAQHDFLTKLPNRVLLNDRIVQAITLAKRRGTHIALLFLDLDNFKHINDLLGHAIGDKLLQSVAQRVSACVRSSDTVSRQGGDEFVILVTEDKYAEDATLTAEKIIAALAESHFIDQHELHVTPSIGISVYPSDAQNAESLIKNADTAMYHAKEKGRNNYQFFKNEMNIRAVKRWKDAGLKPGSIAVNISALEFRSKDFVEGVHAILTETGLEPCCLQLEITESVLMCDAESSTVILQQLKNMGVQLAVDDFGTGYSSLSYLNRFPIDVLKIDRSFVQSIGSTNGNGIIVSAVIAMGNSLNQRVVAEGVEKQAQLAFLKARHCEEGQGYFFSRPLVSEQFASLLAAGISDMPGN